MSDRDSRNRHRALTDLEATLLVEAAAGTGKTSLLAGRVLFLLASGVTPGRAHVPIPIPRFSDSSDRTLALASLDVESCPC